MGTMSLWHWLVVLLVVVLLFGSGRISSVMGDVAKGIKAFRRGMQEEQPPQEPQRVETQQPTAQPATSAPAQHQPATAAPAQPASAAQPATAAQPQQPRA